MLFYVAKSPSFSPVVFVTCSPKLPTILSKLFIYQMTQKRIDLKRTLKFALEQLLHVSVQSPSSGSALFEFSTVTVVKIIH